MKKLLAACSVLTAVLALAESAHADNLLIKRPGAHPDYAFEAEPHLLLEPFHRLGPGAGFRGSIEIVDNGFVRSINNTVAIGFGADFTGNHIWLPVVMQWNFWLSKNWSLFGEPGLVLHVHGNHGGGFDLLALYAGARWHFADDMALTMRLGNPSFTIGVSFLL